MTDPTLTQAAQKRLRDERVFKMLCAVVQGSFAADLDSWIKPVMALEMAEGYVDEFERRTQENESA